MNVETLREDLIRDEGLRLKPYNDPSGKVTIGVGRNLTDVGISKTEAMILLDNDIAAAVNALDQLIPWWGRLDDVRQNVLVNMCFNMGPHKLATFKLALAAMEKGDYAEAAKQMEASAWYEEVGGRAIRLVAMMLNGA